MDVRAQILKEATKLFAAKGFDGTSVQEVADAVGIKKPSLLYHFESKEALRQAVLDEVLARWNDVIPHILLRAAREQQFEAVMESMTSFFLEDADRARLILREALDRPDDLRKRLLTFVQPWIALVAEQLDKGRAKGSVRPDVDSEAYATVVTGLVVSGVALLDSLSIVLSGAPDAKSSQQRVVRELIRVARASLYVTEQARAK